MILLQLFLILPPLVLLGVKAGNILIVPPMVSPSHKLALIALADGLAERGHNVLVYEPSLELNKYNPKRAKIQHFLIESENEFMNKLIAKNDSVSGYLIWEAAFNKPFDESVAAMFTSIFAESYIQQNRKEFLSLLDTEWDLIIADELFNPFGYLLAELLRQKYDTALAVYVSNSRMTLTGANLNNQPTPLAYWPAFGNMDGYSDRMSFLQRSHSVALTYIRHLIGSLKEIFLLFKFSSLNLQYKGVDHSLMQPDIVFTAYPEEFTMSFPLKNNIVHIGGIHVKSKNTTAVLNEIPPEILELIEKHDAGFAVVAMGHMANWYFAPERMKEAFVGAFKRLPKNFLVLFSCSPGFPEERLPSNARAFRWLPQSALFQHPKVRLFFTHGGGNSVGEGAIFGVPMVAMGLFAEQSDGAVCVEKHGLGVRIAKESLSADSLFNAFNLILNDPKYSQNAKRFAQIMGDAPRRAMGRGIFWSEYVMKSRSSLASRTLLRKLIHTENKVTELSWFGFIQYHNLDLICIGCVFIGIFSFVTYYSFKRLYYWIESFKEK